MQKLTIDEYLGKQGLSAPFSDFMFDKLRIPHGLTQRKMKQLHKEAKTAADDYADKRTKAKQEYYRLLEAGEIIEPSHDEQVIKKANGHPDNKSVQAARRLCEKRGIDWRQYDDTDNDKERV